MKVEGVCFKLVVYLFFLLFQALADDQRNIMKHSNTQFEPGYNFPWPGLKLVRQIYTGPDQKRMKFNWKFLHFWYFCLAFLIWRNFDGLLKCNSVLCENRQNNSDQYYFQGIDGRISREGAFPHRYICKLNVFRTKSNFFAGFVAWRSWREKNSDLAWFHCSWLQISFGDNDLEDVQDISIFNV